MTTSLKQATEDVLGMFLTDWETSGRASEISVGSYVPVHSPNVQDDPPTNTNLEWVRANLINTGSGRHSGIGDGTGRYRKDGMLIFQIFTVKGAGIERANDLAQR